MGVCVCVVITCKPTVLVVCDRVYINSVRFALTVHWCLVLQDRFITETCQPINRLGFASGLVWVPVCHRVTELGSDVDLN